MEAEREKELACWSQQGLGLGRGNILLLVPLVADAGCLGICYTGRKIKSPQHKRVVSTFPEVHIQYS